MELYPSNPAEKFMRFKAIEQEQNLRSSAERRRAEAARLNNEGQQSEQFAGELALSMLVERSA